MFLRIREIKRLTILFFIIALCAVIINCSNTNPVNVEVTKHLTAKFYEYITFENIEEFVLSYSEWELKRLNYYHLETNTITFSYNSHSIKEHDFLTMIRNDNKVMRAEFEPFIWWDEHGMLITLREDIVDNSLDEFILSYSHIDLALLAYHKETNEAIFSFDFLKYLCYWPFEIGSSWHVFFSQEPRINEGNIISLEEFYVTLHDNVKGDAIDEFISSYSTYETRIVSYNESFNKVKISFNQYLADYFVFKEILSNDPKVTDVDFSYMGGFHGRF